LRSSLERLRDLGLGEPEGFVVEAAFDARAAVGRLIEDNGRFGRLPRRGVAVSKIVPVLFGRDAGWISMRRPCATIVPGALAEEQLYGS